MSTLYCFSCGREVLVDGAGTSGRCGGCKVATYCSVACQREDWEQPGGHAAACEELGQLDIGAAGAAAVLATIAIPVGIGAIVASISIFSLTSGAVYGINYAAKKLHKKYQTRGMPKDNWRKESREHESEEKATPRGKLKGGKLNNFSRTPPPYNDITQRAIEDLFLMIDGGENKLVSKKKQEKGEKLWKDLSSWRGTAQKSRELIQAVLRKHFSTAEQIQAKWDTAEDVRQLTQLLYAEILDVYFPVRSKEHPIYVQMFKLDLLVERYVRELLNFLAYWHEFLRDEFNRPDRIEDTPMTITKKEIETFRKKITPMIEPLVDAGLELQMKIRELHDEHEWW